MIAVGATNRQFPQIVQDRAGLCLAHRILRASAAFLISSGRSALKITLWSCFLLRASVTWHYPEQIARRTARRVARHQGIAMNQRSFLFTRSSALLALPILLILTGAVRPEAPDSSLPRTIAEKSDYKATS